VARCFWLGRGDRNAGWADRSGGAEFRLPLLIGVFGFAALQAVIPNKAMSLIVVLTALPARSFAIPFLEVIAHWTIAVNLLAGSLIGAWLGARSTGAPSQLSYIDAGLVDLVVPMCCIALIMVAARRIRIFLHSSSVQCRGGGRAVVADRWLAGALAGGSAGRCVWLATALAPPVAGLRGLGGDRGSFSEECSRGGSGECRAGQLVLALPRSRPRWRRRWDWSPRPAGEWSRGTDPRHEVLA
jgi:hypothetical protein